MTVLIIGAGAAGLTAAYDLKRAGVDVRVIEASSRIGGRIKKLEGWASFPIDLGAEWIHVNPSILTKIVNNPSKPVTVQTVPYKSHYSEWNGKQFVPETLKDKDHKFVNYTWFDFFNDYIAPTVMESIEFNCPVSKIDWSTTPVQAAGSNGRSFSGSHIIVTVPIKILQDGVIQFVPEFPSKVKTALNAILMPEGYKVFLKFRDRFYPDSFGLKSDFKKLTYKDSDRYFYDATYGQAHAEGEHIMGVSAFGELATDFATLDDESLLHSILAILDTIFHGAATKNFIDGVVQNWNREPYAHGCYSFYKDSWRQIDTLRKPLGGHLFFAGEAIPASDTDYDTAFAHGAALSGRETAKLVIRSLKGS